MEDIFDCSSILLIGNDPTHQHPLLAYQIRQAVRQRGTRLYVVNNLDIKLHRQAALYLKVNARGESTAVRVLAGSASCSPDLCVGGENELNAFREKLRQESDTVIIFGDEIQGDAVGELVRWGLSLQGRTRFAALGDYVNSRGAADMGLLPNTLPGYSSIADDDARHVYESAWGSGINASPGRNLRQILDDARSGAGEIFRVGYCPRERGGVGHEGDAWAPRPVASEGDQS